VLPFPALPVTFELTLKSVGFLIVVCMAFLGAPPWLWIELFELLCFIVDLKSVDIMPMEMVELFVVPTPVTCMVPEGCRAASIPFCFTTPLFGLANPFFVANFFLMMPFCTGPLRAMLPVASPCG